MRKLFLLFAMMLGLASASMADQLEYVSESEAKAAVELLQNQKYVLLYCGCCGDDDMQYVKIESVSYRYTGYETYYEVVVEGRDSMGMLVNTTIDLAYAHIQKKKNAVCVGKVLKLDCDPCVTGLKWSCSNF